MLLIIGNNMLKCHYKYYCFYSTPWLKPSPPSFPDPLSLARLPLFPSILVCLYMPFLALFVSVNFWISRSSSFYCISSNAPTGKLTNTCHNACHSTGLRAYNGGMTVRFLVASVLPPCPYPYDGAPALLLENGRGACLFLSGSGQGITPIK